MLGIATGIIISNSGMKRLVNVNDRVHHEGKRLETREPSTARDLPHSWAADTAAAGFSALADLRTNKPPPQPLSEDVPESSMLE